MRYELVLCITAVMTAFALMLSVTSGAAADEEVENEQPQSQTFAIHYAAGPKWLEGKPLFEQPLQAHGEYMAKLLDEGVLVIAGPYLDDSGGLAIVQARNIDHVKEIIASDPAVRDGVFTAEAQPWQVVFSSVVRRTAGVE